MSLRDHLVELRNRIFVCAVAIAVGAVVGWFIYNPVYHLLLHPLADLCSDACSNSITPAGKLLTNDPLEPFLIKIKIAAYVGIALAMPVVLWELWRFIAPGLYSNEKKYGLLFVGSAMALFLAGAATAYFTLPKVLTWLQEQGGGNYVLGYSAGKYLRLIGWMMVAFGVGFEFPIVLVTLQAVGVLPNKFLRKYWRYAIVLIAIIAGVITPSADPITFLALAIPMSIFYGASILIGLVIERRRRRRASVST
jgi:sec-independent protein translocase protein TatC